MIQRTALTTALMAALMAALVALPVVAQPAKARATANVDLDARFKEAQTSPQLADDLYKVGRKVAAVCANCHGEGGTSTKPSIPNLAGQNPAYLLEQMRQFADGRRRNEFMEGMIRAMSSDEKIGMVLFYAAQQVAHQTPANPMLAAKGQEYFEKTCFRCHGTGGRAMSKSPASPGSSPTTCA